MDITTVIARNLDALIAGHPGLDTSEKVAAASGVGYGTVRRTRKAEGNVTVQNLEAIAGAFRLHAVDLMTEPGGVKHSPAAPTVKLSVVSEPESIPPDERLLLHGYRAASEELRDIMLDVARRAVAKQEQPGRSDHQ